MRLIFDTVTCQGSKDKTGQDHDFFHTTISLKSRPLVLSSSSSLLVLSYLRCSSQQTTKHVMRISVCKNVRILIFGARGSAANILRASGSTVK